MEHGFWLAGEPLIRKRQRDIAVSPRNQNAKKFLALVDSGLGDFKDEAANGPGESAEAVDEWERLANKYEDLEEKVNEYLNTEQDMEQR